MSNLRRNRLCFLRGIYLLRNLRMMSNNLRRIQWHLRVQTRHLIRGLGDHLIIMLVIWLIEVLERDVSVVCLAQPEARTQKI